MHYLEYNASAVYNIRDTNMKYETIRIKVFLKRYYSAQ